MAALPLFPLNSSTPTSDERRATKPAYLAFDLGASSGRAMLGLLETDRLRLETLHRFPTPILEVDGHLFWDLDAVWTEIRHGLHLALERAPNLRSVSVDSWGVDYVPLDANGEPVRLPYCYRDPRTDGAFESAFAVVPPERIYAATGIQFMTINTLYQILDDARREPDLLARTANRLTIADYFNHRLGGRPVCEVSLASTTQLMDVHTRSWSADLLRAFDLPTTGWPEIVPSGTVIGHTARAPQVQIVAGCSHDTACAVVATPAADDTDDWAYISCGTWSLLGTERSEPLLTDAARTAGFTNEAGVDGTIRFLKNLTGLWALQECIREWDLNRSDVYKALLREARTVSPDEVARIHLEEERFLARGGMEARLQAYCRETDQPVPQTRGEITRVIIESIVESYRNAVADLERVTGRAVEVLHLVGGGSQNALLCERTAEVCNRTVIAGPVEATALGNLVVQIRALGDLPAGMTMRKLIRRSTQLITYQSITSKS